MKLLGKWVRLPDGREGHVAASGIDGLVVIVDGRMVTVKPAEATEIPAPYSPPIPEPERTAQPPIQTNHTELPAQVRVPQGVSVMVGGKWSNQHTWPLGSK